MFAVPRNSPDDAATAIFEFRGQAPQRPKRLSSITHSFRNVSQVDYATCGRFCKRMQATGPNCI